MYVLLVLRENGQGVQVVVKVQTKRMREQVVALLEDNQGREAFDLLKKRAEVAEWVPSGMRPEVSTAFTLVEEML